MIKIKQTVIVEGKYDKIKLANIIDANIISTDGFAIFKDKEKMQLIRKIAQKDGIIILTDSDSAGAVIRGHLCSCINPEYITNVFVPCIKGKEKRKREESKEGYLGVEGIDASIIKAAFSKANIETVDKADKKITSADLYRLQLSGCDNSKEKRLLLQQKLGLPKVMSTKQLLGAINALYSCEEFEKIMGDLNG